MVEVSGSIKGAWGEFASPFPPLEALPHSPSDEKNGQNQPFFSSFFLFLPPQKCIFPLDDPAQKISGAATG